MTLSFIAPPRFGASPRREDALSKRIAKGYRHSLLVKIMHMVLPSLLLFFIFTTLGLNIMTNLMPRLPFNTDKLIINGSKLMMMSPNLNGFMKDNKAYHVKADHAEQDLKQPTLIDLFNLRAEVELDKGGFAVLVAKIGTMQTDKEYITFKNGVTVTTTSGHYAETNEAFVDAKAGVISAPNVVHLKSPTGELTSDRMDIRDNGQYMLFDGSVRGYFIPSKPDSEISLEEKQ